VSTVAKLDFSKPIAPIAWYPMLQGFGLRMLLPHELVQVGDLQLSAGSNGVVMYCRPFEIGRGAGAEGYLVFRYTAWAGDADPAMVADCVRRQIEQAQADAWESLCAAVALFRAALTTGKPDLIRMRDNRALEIMEKHDFGCRVTFDSVTGQVWRGGDDVFDDLFEDESA
jgi:hypothetical protein